VPLDRVALLQLPECSPCFARPRFGGESGTRLPLRFDLGRGRREGVGTIVSVTLSAKLIAVATGDPMILDRTPCPRSRTHE